MSKFLDSGRLAFALALGACALSAPAAAADFYAGKTINFVVGGDAGGGYDLYARAIARHLPQHIPGHPTIIVQNQPGAGSMLTAAAIYTTAAKDGTAIAALFPGAIIGKLLDDNVNARFDPTKFAYIATADSGTRVCITLATSKIKRYEDMLTTKTIMGASAAGGSTRDYGYWHKHATGAQLELVSGYKGTVDIFLAIEKGEVDGMCGIDWASLKSQRPGWIRDKTVNILVQDGLEPEPELTRLGVPQVWKYVHEADLPAVRLIVTQQVFGRPYVAPPEIPPDRLQLLRDGFAATMADKSFLEDAEKTHLDVTPSSGEKVQKVVAEAYAQPKEVIDRAKRLIQP